MLIHSLQNYVVILSITYFFICKCYLLQGENNSDKEITPKRYWFSHTFCPPTYPRVPVHALKASIETATNTNANFFILYLLVFSFILRLKCNMIGVKDNFKARFLTDFVFFNVDFLKLSGYASKS